MKKIRITFICCCIILFAGCLLGCRSATQDCLRIHIRANSNLNCDQAVKYQVRDQVVDYLTPKLKNCQTKDEALDVVKQNESAVKALIDALLKQKGFNYTCKISFKNEYFPTRVYEDVTLKEGLYEAIIIELGQGVGDNWWCIVYPNLCFAGDGDVEYRSKIWEIINNL